MKEYNNPTVRTFAWNPFEQTQVATATFEKDTAKFRSRQWLANVRSFV